MAIAIPMSTNTTIAPCIQIHVGDISEHRLARRASASSGSRRAQARYALAPTGSRGAQRSYLVAMVAGRVSKPTLALASALCVLACVCAPASLAARGHRASTSLQAGVNIGGIDSRATPAEAERAVAYAQQLHARLVRVPVAWSLLEPTGPNALEPQALAYIDRVVEAAAADGIRVIFTVQSTPCWVSSAPASLLRQCRPGTEGAANAWPPTQPAAFASFCAYLASRYGTRLAAIEVWNEPDQSNEQYWAGPNKAAQYAALLRAAYPAIKAAAPSVLVLAGSLVGTNGAFLRLLYADGIKGYYDGLSVHFYTLTLEALRVTREVQLAHGDHKPLWLDEFGWPSCAPRERIEQEQSCLSPQLQATNLRNTLRALARIPYVAAAIDYKLQDSSTEDFGLLSAGGAHKPSFGAFVSALTAPFGSISPVTLRLRVKGASVIASGSAPVGDLMRLEAFAGERLRYWAVLALNRLNQYSVALPPALGTSGLRIRVYQYWSGPTRAAQKTI
jgi:polysaccharide biosynthesis protein PslG